MTQYDSSVEDCDLCAIARGLCSKHYQRLKRTGRTDRQSSLSRWMDKVDKNGPIPVYAPELGPCWLWTACLFQATGYGQFHDQGKKVASAHRWGYEHLVGAVSSELHLDHLCRIRNCVNPDHLEPVTPAENSRRIPRSIRPQSEACTKGHSFTPENTYTYPNLRRLCRTCRNEWLQTRRMTV
jgi:5-methylcytosine-specific restriction endonuclease McrA